MNRVQLVLAALAVLAAGLSWWLGHESSDGEAVTASPAAAVRAIDYRIRGFEVVRMTSAGAPAHRLAAQSLRHFTDDDTTELDQPRLTVFQTDAPPWEVDAQQAWMSADGSLILLTGEVLINRAGDADTPPTRVVTRDLRIQPRDDYAETDERVTVETDTDRLDAVGMQAWLRPPSRLKFLSDVKGLYVPR